LANWLAEFGKICREKCGHKSCRPLGCTSCYISCVISCIEPLQVGVVTLYSQSITSPTLNLHYMIHNIMYAFGQSIVVDISNSMECHGKILYFQVIPLCSIIHLTYNWIE